jgi:acetyltransferase-like isoleucine patch superfamily enzyme/dTDP-4-dehydrorhamnose 3,5-epimerase-like enzyme
MSHFVHPAGLCETTRVGEGTRIWAFAHVLPGARIGCDCNICDHVFIENDVVLGDRVTVKCGVQLWDGLRVGDDVFIGPNATFTNDKFPRSKQRREHVLRTAIASGASIGANATILPGVKIGGRAMVGAGSVVTRDVPPKAVVVGNPARIRGYVDAQRRQASAYAYPEPRPAAAVLPTAVAGVTLRRLKSVADLRGRLSVGQFDDDIPFAVKRYFIVYDVPSANVRGEHAHRRCEQFLVCVKGTVSVIVDDGFSREEIVFDCPDVGLHIPAMVWGVQYRYSSDAVLLVFASELYDPADYIRDYDHFLSLVTEVGVAGQRRAAA